MKINYDKNPKILNDFLDFLHKIKNYSENTRKSYCLDLLCFFRFLKDYRQIGVDVKEFDLFILLGVEEADMIAFLVYLNFYKNNTASTRRRKLSCVRLFYRWLISKFPNSSGKNPTENVPSIRKMSCLPKCLTLEQAKRMTGIFTLENCLYPKRNNMIISLFLNTGMRLSELCHIDLKDIDFEKKYIQITGKGNKERRVLINERMKNELLEYLKVRRINYTMVSLNDPLFVGHQNKRLGNAGVERVCKKAFRLMGLEEFRYSTHTLRHSFATIMYQYVGLDIVLLKEVLGHSSVESTEIYTHVGDADIKNAVEHNPLNDFYGNVA